MIAVNFLAIQNLTENVIGIGDLDFKLEPFEAKDILGMFTLKQVMDSGGIGIFLDQKKVGIEIQLNDDLKQIRSSGALRAALKEVVVCHTCGNQN